MVTTILIKRMFNDFYSFTRNINSSQKLWLATILYLYVIVQFDRIIPPVMNHFYTGISITILTYILFLNSNLCLN